MACFVVPLVEGIVVSSIKAIAFRKDSAKETVRAAREKILVLEKMLYGGSFLLAAEHLYHGEISFFPPFLTAMKTPEEIPVMLHEMATIGVGMAVLVTSAWALGLGVIHLFRKIVRSNRSNKVCAY